MNHHDYNSLFAALNQAVEILHRNRTPDPEFITAYDTLKQARALLEKIVQPSDVVAQTAAVELAA